MHATRTLITIASIALSLAVAGCRRPEVVTPGIYIAADGSIQRADPRLVRDDCQQRMAQTLADRLGPGWGVRVQIAELPYSFDERAWMWDVMTISVDVQRIVPDADLTLTVADMVGTVQRMAAPRIRTGNPPAIRISLPEGVAAAPALAADGVDAPPVVDAAPTADDLMAVPDSEQGASE